MVDVTLANCRRDPLPSVDAAIEDDERIAVGCSDGEEVDVAALEGLAHH